jgi:tetratricopeptide (TPR) repeat protein
MTASGQRLANGLLAGLVLLLAGCMTAYQHGQAALRDGRYLEAAARFSEALADDPASVNALLGLGLAQYHLDSFQAAVGFLGRAVLAAPGNAEAHLYLALTYLALEDQGAAARPGPPPRPSGQPPCYTAGPCRSRSASSFARASRTRPTGTAT